MNTKIICDYDDETKEALEIFKIITDTGTKCSSSNKNAPLKITTEYGISIDDIIKTIQREISYLLTSDKYIENMSYIATLCKYINKEHKEYFIRLNDYYYDGINKYSNTISIAMITKINKGIERFNELYIED